MYFVWVPFPLRGKKENNVGELSRNIKLPLYEVVFISIATGTWDGAS